MFEKLKQAGYTDEEAKKLEKIFNEHLDGNYVTKDRFNSVNEDNKALKKTIAERDSQLDSLKKSAGDNEALKTQIEQLKEANKTAEAQYKAELKASKTKSAVRGKIGEQAYDSDMVVGLIDLTKIELDENDNIKSGFDEQFNTLKKEKAFLFKPEQNKKSEFKFEGAKSFESNKESEQGKPKGFGAKLAEMKLGTENSNSKASDYYFGTTQK